MPRNKLEISLTFSPYVHVLKKIIYLQHIANLPHTFTDDKGVNKFYIPTVKC